MIFFFFGWVWLRFLIKNCMLSAPVFWEVLPRSVSQSKGNLDISFGTKWNWGEDSLNTGV